MSVSWMVLIAVLWLLVIIMALILVGLLRRVVTLESLVRSGRPARNVDPMSGVPPVGATFPLIDALLAPATQRGDTALLFLGSGCAPCRTLAKELATTMEDPSSYRLVAPGNELVVVTEPTGASMFAGIGRLVIDQNREFRRTLGVMATPMGFGVDAAGIVRAADFVPDASYVRELFDSCKRNLSPITDGDSSMSVWHSNDKLGGRGDD